MVLIAAIWRNHTGKNSLYTLQNWSKFQSSFCCLFKIHRKWRYSIYLQWHQFYNDKKKLDQHWEEPDKILIYLQQNLWVPFTNFYVLRRTVTQNTADWQELEKNFIFLLSGWQRGKVLVFWRHPMCCISTILDPGQICKSPCQIVLQVGPCVPAKISISVFSTCGPVVKPKLPVIPWNM